MKKKNIIALFLATVMLVSLVSCADPVAGGSGNVINPGAAPSEPVPVETEALTLGSMELPLPDPAQSSVVTVDEVEKIIATAREICNADTTITLSDGSVLYCRKITNITSTNMSKVSREELYKYQLYVSNTSTVIMDMIVSRFPDESVKWPKSPSNFPHRTYFFLDLAGEGFEDAYDAYKNGIFADEDANPDGMVSVIACSRNGNLRITSYEKGSDDSTLLFPASDDEAMFFESLAVKVDSNGEAYESFVKELTGKDVIEYLAPLVEKVRY